VRQLRHDERVCVVSQQPAAGSRQAVQT
jgi:hypothetical protein